MHIRNVSDAAPWKRFLALFMVLVSFCSLLPLSSLAGEAQPRIGGMTLADRREARVFPGTLDSVYTLTTWTFQEQEDVPYVSLKEYVALLFVDSFNPVCDFSWDGDTFLVTRNRMNVAVDTVGQTVSCADWHAFFGPNAANALPNGVVEKVEFLAIRPSVKNRSDETPSQGFSLCLKDYGVEFIRVEEDVLAPFAAAQAVFACPAEAAFLAYNGNDYYDIVNSVESIYGSAQMAYAPNPYANMWYSGSFAARKELSEAYTKYNYAAMCMLLDITYGHKEEKGIRTFDAYMEEQGLKEALLTPDPKDDVEPLTTLFTMLFDSGHDANVLTRSIIDSEGAIEAADLIHRILSVFGFDTVADIANALDPLLTILMKLMPKDMDLSASETLGPNVLKLMAEMIRMRQLKPLRYGSNRVDIVGDTCVIYFEGFKENLTRPESFYRKLPVKSDWETSSFALFYSAFEKIKENGNVKNVVIDLSNNGGGSAAALVATLGFLSPDGEVKITYKDMLSRNYRTEWYHVDTNLDGSFDDKDGYGGQYSFYVLTSGHSYSCGNAFPYFAQMENQAKIIGEQPGGGDCVVATYLDAFGHVGVMSGFKQLGTLEGDVFVSDETAVVVDHPFTAEEGNAVYFHPDRIAKYVHGITE